MKILFVNHHRKAKTHFRAGRLAEGLAVLGHDVTVLCISDEKRIGVVEYEQSGVHYVESPDLLPGKLRSGWDPWDTYCRTRWLLKNKKSFDLIHAFDTRPVTIYPLRAFRKRHPIPLFIDWCDWWGRGGLITELRPKWYQLLFGQFETYYEEHFRTAADGTTVIAKALQERAHGLGVPNSRIFHISGGVDTNQFVAIDSQHHRRKFGIPHEIPVLGFSAADVTMDYPIVLQAVKRLIAKHPTLMLIMTGNIPSDFHKRVAELGLDNHTRHFGFVPYKDLPDLLSCADIFVLPFPDKPANRGRWPNKLGNYMSLGRPTVTNSCGDLTRLLAEHEIGLLSEESSQSVADNIDRLIRDTELRHRMGKTARQVAVNNYDWPRIIEQLIRAYDTVLGA